MRPFGSTVALASVLGAGACAFSAEMSRSAPASPCPGELLAPARETPDTTVLRWYRATDERDVQLSSRWCETVGPPVVVPRPATSFPAWERGSGLDVVTWNVHINGGDVSGFLQDELGLDCSAAPPRIDPGRPPFVLLLQEVWRHSDALPYVERSRSIPWTIDVEHERADEADIVEVAERCGLALVYVPSARNGPDTGSRPGEDKGNAILSSLPLTTPIAIDLPLEGGRKVALAATVRSPGGQRVRVVTVHLDVASTLIRALASGNQTRARQVKGLIEALDEAERDGPLTQVAVVGGDFNAWAGNETTLKLMGRAFPQSPAWDGLGTRGAFPPDHIFFGRASFRAFTVEGYRKIDDLHGSDHNARGLTLRYAPVSGGG